MKKAVNGKVLGNPEKANRLSDKMLRSVSGGKRDPADSERRRPFALDVNPPWNPPAEKRRWPFSIALMLPMGRRPRPLGWKWGDDWSADPYFG